MIAFLLSMMNDKSDDCFLNSSVFGKGKISKGEIDTHTKLHYPSSRINKLLTNAAVVRPYKVSKRVLI